MVICLVILQDAYAFSSKQATFFYDSVSKGMEGFGLENHNVSYSKLFKWIFLLNILKIDKTVHHE